jgi:hypothetical protein
MLVSQLMYSGQWSEKYLQIGYGLAYALVAMATVALAVRLVQKCNSFFGCEGDLDEESADDALEGAQGDES